MSVQKLRAQFPWKKPKEELAQFDWLTAIGQSPAHRCSPTDLRCAQELMRFSSGETMLAYPTVQTLAGYIGCHRSGASKAIANLRKSGALQVMRISELPPELSNQIGRKGRGNVYFLNMQWAADIFEMRTMLRRKEPPGLKSGRLKTTTNVADTFTIPPAGQGHSIVATPATSIVAAPATQPCSGHRDTNIDTEIERNRTEAGNGKNVASFHQFRAASEQVPTRTPNRVVAVQLGASELSTNHPTVMEI